MGENKNKIKLLFNILLKCKNNNNSVEIENIINDIKSEKLKFVQISKKSYFNTILNIIFSYYEINRDDQTEKIYNYLLELIETSVSS